MQVPVPGLGRFPGEGNGSPLQYSCLENPIDWGWVTKGHTRLKQLSTRTHTGQCEVPLASFWEITSFQSEPQHFQEVSRVCFRLPEKFPQVLHSSHHPPMAGLAAASVGMDVLLCRRGRGFSIFPLKNATCFTLVAHSTVRSRGKHEVKFSQVF